MNTVFSNVVEVKRVLPQGKTFTLVGGCFDLIHVGHLHLLEYAASLEEILVVAVLTDAYARSYKDPSRPIINERQRARMVASIRGVDFVYLSDVSPSSSETLQLLKPNSVVFGEDTRNTAKMRQRMENLATFSPGTKICLLPRYSEEEVSTSLIIAKIRGGV